MVENYFQKVYILVIQRIAYQIITLRFSLFFVLKWDLTLLFQHNHHDIRYSHSDKHLSCHTLAPTLLLFFDFIEWFRPCSNCNKELKEMLLHLCKTFKWNNCTKKIILKNFCIWGINFFAPVFDYSWLGTWLSCSDNSLE